MNNKRTLYRCDICGNLVEKIEDSGVTMVCCNQDMTLLIANSVDASKEKHLPVITKKDSTLEIKIGSEQHPMTKEHHIGWIIVATKTTTTRKELAIGEEPIANVKILEDEPITVYAWCSLHGLWVSEI